MSCRTRRRAGGAGFGYAGFLASLTLSLFGGCGQSSHDG